MRRWTKEEEDFLKKEYPIHGKKYCCEKLNRPEGSIRKKAETLALRVEDIGKTQRWDAFNKHLEYLKTTEYVCLESFETYKGNSTKLKHLHKTCGYVWEISTNNIPKIVGCPGCSKKGYKEFEETLLYLAYFPALDLYKVGVTVSWDRRKYDFGYKAELLYLEVFETGKEAYSEERKLKQALEPYLHNSNELRNGNRETFLWPT